VNEKGFISFAAYGCVERRIGFRAAKLMKPLSELNGESSLAL